MRKNGTNPPIPVSNLSLYRLSDTVTGKWTKLDSTVDTTAKTVSGLTDKFSVFALFGPTDIQLDTSSVLIFPIPWKPGSGGKFDSVSFQGKTGLAFGNLTSDGAITIFTISGERVVKLEYTGFNQGTFIWDGRNSSGRSIASGVAPCTNAAPRSRMRAATSSCVGGSVKEGWPSAGDPASGIINTPATTSMTKCRVRFVDCRLTISCSKLIDSKLTFRRLDFLLFTFSTFTSYRDTVCISCRFRTDTAHCVRLSAFRGG